MSTFWDTHISFGQILVTITNERFVALRRYRCFTVLQTEHLVKFTCNPKRAAVVSFILSFFLKDFGYFYLQANKVFTFVNINRKCNICVSLQSVSSRGKNSNSFQVGKDLISLQTIITQYNREKFLCCVFHKTQVTVSSSCRIDKYLCLGMIIGDGVL